MIKIMDLPDGTTMDDIEKLASYFKYSIVMKLRENLELWIEGEDSEKTEELEALKRLFSHLTRDAPPPDSPHRGEYEETMRQLEAEIRERGVDL